MMSYKSTYNSPMKSMVKSPRMLRKRRKASKKSVSRAVQPENKLNTMIDLSAIVAGLNEVLETGKFTIL